MKSNISELLEILFFLFFYIFKGIGHVNAVTLHVVCLHLGNFKCFYKKSIFIHLWEHLTAQQPQVTLKTSSVFFVFVFFTLNYFTIAALFLYLFIHDSKATWLQKVIPKGASVQILSIFLKNILIIPNWCNVHVSHCNVFILTVKIFCEKRKLIKITIIDQSDLLIHGWGWFEYYLDQCRISTSCMAAFFFFVSS